MKVKLRHVEYQEKEKRILATISFSEKGDDTWESAQIAVFIPWTDSYEEIKRLSIEKAKAFALRAASAR